MLQEGNTLWLNTCCYCRPSTQHSRVYQQTFSFLGHIQVTRQKVLRNRWSFGNLERKCEFQVLFKCLVYEMKKIRSITEYWCVEIYFRFVDVNRKIHIFDPMLTIVRYIIATLVHFSGVLIALWQTIDHQVSWRNNTNCCGPRGNNVSTRFNLPPILNDSVNSGLSL
jgi:hypothetical protein